MEHASAAWLARPLTDGQAAPTAAGSDRRCGRWWEVSEMSECRKCRNVGQLSDCVGGLSDLPPPVSCSLIATPVLYTTQHSHSTAHICTPETKIHNAHSIQMLPSSCRVATMIAESKPRCASQNLESHFSLLHSSLRQKYSVERFSEGSATSSLCILQVSEGECQGIKSSV